MPEPRDVHLVEARAMGIYTYTVVADGKPYDQFFSKRPLTWSEQNDVESYYREGLTR